MRSGCGSGEAGRLPRRPSARTSRLVITFLALGSRGDVQPYAELGGALRAAGHETKFVTTGDFRDLIVGKGLHHFALRGSARAAVATAGPDVLALLRAFREISASVIDQAGELVPLLASSDLILNQLPGALFSVDITEKFGVPTWQVGTIPLVQTRSFPVMGAPSWLGRLPGANRASYRAAELLGTPLIAALVTKWRQEVLGLPALRWFRIAGDQRRRVSRTLLGISPRVVERPDDWSADVHLTGYWFNSPADWNPDSDLKQFLEDGSPPIFVGFGSMPVRDPARVTEDILGAASELGERVVLHRGWGGMGVGALPETVYPVDDIPYSWLFPRMKLLVHHGGAGTTAEAVRSGRPSLVVPFAFDQFYWGGLLKELGVAVAPLPFREWSRERLVRRLTAGLASSSLEAAGQRLARKVREEDGFRAAVDLIGDLS